MTVNFSTPICYDGPQTTRQSISNFIEGYFYLGGERAHVIDPKNHLVSLDNDSSPFLISALKVFSYATLLIPATMFLLKACLRCSANYRIKPLDPLVANAPQFASYKIGKGTPHEGTNLTAMNLRPSNLFYRALFGRDATTLPGQGLFAFQMPHGDIKNLITRTTPGTNVSFSAKGVPGSSYTRVGRDLQGQTVFNVRNIPDLSAVYGDGTYNISFGELQSTLASQKIYTSPLLPLPFYSALKAAMKQDGMVTLPGNDGAPVKVKDLQTAHCKTLVDRAARDFRALGFASEQACRDLLDLTVYQLGALVVKTEDFRIFMDVNGNILNRNPGEQDGIRLINACGIRGIHHTPATAISNKNIMTSTFQTALASAESGFVVFPAVGMGVWGGDPDLYWRALLDAVVSSGTNIEKIFVNPGHQASPSGVYRGCRGEELSQLLNEYRTRYIQDPVAYANLEKVVNLYSQKTDVVHLSHQLKKAYPTKIVSLFNASDPDVTLGYHVGEYVNNLDHATTTEENYTAMGTNGLCFETITGVHEDPRRLIH